VVASSSLERSKRGLIIGCGLDAETMRLGRRKLVGLLQMEFELKQANKQLMRRKVGISNAK
jgi:hypothetical protein